MKRLFVCVASLLLCGMSAQRIYADALSEIVVQGNKKTRDEIIKQEMSLKVGDEISAPAIEQSRQAIMDLGLFRRVEIKQEEEADVTRLVVTVKEKKHDWYILPRIERNADGDITLGMNLRASNVNGLNQKSKLTIAHKQYQDATTDQSYGVTFKFSYPRIVGTPYSAFTYGGVAQSTLDEERNGVEGSYERREGVFGIGVGRWFSASGISQGWHAAAGIEYQRFEHEFLNGTPGLFDNVTEIGLSGSVSYKLVHDLIYSRSGYTTGMVVKQANSALGSDRPYFNKYLFYRQYVPLSWREHTNFNFQVQAASGNRSIFGGPIYELSGSHTLRGYRRETLEGDAYFLVNTQFLTPIFGNNSLRAGALFDFGNAYNSLSQIKEFEFESGAGVSLRWKLKQWVNTELRIDYAQGLGDLGESRIYVSGGAMF